jgi:hypothetical protein
MARARQRATARMGITEEFEPSSGAVVPGEGFQSGRANACGEMRPMKWSARPSAFAMP